MAIESVAIESVDCLLGALMKSAEGISDIIFTVGRPPQVEVYGRLQTAELDPLVPALTPEDTETLALGILGDNRELHGTLKHSGSCDCAYSLPSSSIRFRVNIFNARGHLSVVMRALASTVPDLDALCLPPAIHEIPNLRDGLVLVTGSTGSGKSTTLAAIIDRINRDRPLHIVTLEDPVEFLHQHKAGTINQRELGSDFHCFADGLKAALCQAPKVILVGEMRDRETVEIAIKAAETGHLVLSTLHTIDAGQTINRITGMFNIEERQLVRSRLAEVLRFVVGQRLLPRESGGRVPALEIMVSTMRIQELVQGGEDGEKTFYKIIADGEAYGMQTFDQHILKLYEDEIISENSARGFCTDGPTMGQAIDRIRAGRGEDTSDIGELEMAQVSKNRWRDRPTHTPRR